MIGDNRSSMFTLFPRGWLLVHSIWIVWKSGEAIALIYLARLKILNVPPCAGKDEDASLDQSVYSWPARWATTNIGELHQQLSAGFSLLRVKRTLFTM